MGCCKLMYERGCYTPSIVVDACCGEGLKGRHMRQSVGLDAEVNGLLCAHWSTEVLDSVVENSVLGTGNPNAKGRV